MTSLAGDAAAVCQLSYSLQSIPAVLQASVTGAESSMATINLTIFNNTQAVVTVESIVVTLPVGDDAASLVADVSSIVPTAAPSAAWTVNSPSKLEAGTPASYTILPQSGASAPLAAGAAIVLTLTGVAINTATGTASVTIDETTSQGEASTAINVTKYPPGFFFDNLLVNVANGSALQPVAQVAYNAAVTLSWVVSAIDPSAIAIYYSSNGGQQGPLAPASLNQSQPITLVADTVFTVIVTTTAAGGEPVVSALSTSVSVATPDAVLNQVQAQGLTVAQAATFQGGVSAGAGVAVTGGLATDTVQTTGLATLAAAAAVTGGLTTDSLGASGPVAMFGAATAVPVGSGTAASDGFLVGWIGAPSDPSQICVAWLSLSGSTAVVMCTGGNVLNAFANNNIYCASNHGSCILPVAKGEAYSIAVTQGQYNAVAAPIGLWWIPLGTATTTVDDAHAPAPEPTTATVEQPFGQSGGLGERQ